MSSLWRGSPPAVIALLMLTAGCVGMLPDDLGEEAAQDAVGEASEELQASESEKPEDEFVVLTLAFESGKESRASLAIEGLSIDPSPTGPSAFVPRPGELRPGQHQAMAALAVERGTVVRSFHVEIELRDGLGQARLVLDVADWKASEDTYLTIHLSMPELGTVEVDGSEGPVAVNALTPTSVPSYGYILWPTGGKRVLPDFGHVIHVPQAYPKLGAGDRETFHVEGAEETVRWVHDDEEPHKGETFELTVQPGHHTLDLTVGDGDTLTLRYAANDHQEMNGTVIAGHDLIDTPVEGINGNSHPLEIHEQNRRTLIYLRPAGDVTVEGDLDLYMADEEGQWIARAATPGTSYEQLIIRTPMAPGDYTLWIHDREGALVDYVVTTFVIY